MDREQASEVADAAAVADSTLRGLIWRTRWNLNFEEGIVRGATNYDEVLMNLAGQNRRPPLEKSLLTYPIFFRPRCCKSARVCATISYFENLSTVMCTSGCGLLADFSVLDILA
jgi:hypothetical protein